MSRRSSYPPIEDLGLIGNCRTAALVSKHGSIEWLCVPRFDSPSLFGALLDREKGGSFDVGPATSEYRVTRRYVGLTPILETTFHTDGGILQVTDLMPVVDREEGVGRPLPEHQILRRIECTAGEVGVKVYLEPRPDYGRGNPPMESRGPLGIWCQSGAESITLLGDFPFEIGDHPNHVRGVDSLSGGDVRWLSLTYTHREPTILLDPAEDGEQLIRMTRDWWEGWAGHCDYEGPFANQVVRSAITLKLLNYAPSGAVLAAPTTSLPETLGGARNWDYRYCWLRDASWTLRALFGLGVREEADAFYDWMLYATRLTAPKLQALYDIRGRTNLAERTLEHLEGYEGSRPVRIGNGAHDQFQLDVYGEVVVAAFEWVDHGGTLDDAEKRFLVGIAEEVCRTWFEPDDGIWEIRGDRRHHTYSKVMAWAALDRICKLYARNELEGIDVPVDKFEQNLRLLRDQIEARAYDPEHDCYTATYDERRVDAALLRLPAAGYVKASDSRMRNTYRHVRQVLDAGNDLLYRYEPGFDDLEGLEGAFNICSFWAIECQALAGDVEGAWERFGRMCDRSNDLGLYSEETDPESGRFLGNFPQAFTHIGLINAALTVEACTKGHAATAETLWEHPDAPEGEEARRGGGRPYQPLAGEEDGA